VRTLARWRTRAGGVLARERALNTALLLSALLFLATAAAAAAQLVSSPRINRDGGCGFDGYYYCAMLKGAVVPTPFNRRILLPFLASHIDANGLAGFWVVNVASLIAATAIAMYAALRLRPVAGARSAPVAYTLLPPLLIGAVFLSARNNFHILATYPALSDPLGLLLLVSVIALVVTPVLPSTRLLLLPLCFLAPLQRTELALVLSLALVLAAALRMMPWLLAVAASVAGAGGSLVAFQQPDAGPGQCLNAHGAIVTCPASVPNTLRFWLDYDFGSWTGFFRFFVMLVLGLGPFVLLLGKLRGAPWNRLAGLWLVGIAAVYVAVVVFAGGDTDRLLTPAALLLALAAVITAGRSGKVWLGLTLVVLAYAVQQDPLQIVSGDPTAWLQFFGLRVTEISSVVRNGLVPSLIALPIALAGALLVRPNVDRRQISGDGAAEVNYPRELVNRTNP
jgi:hypothetical protein